MREVDTAQLGQASLTDAGSFAGSSEIRGEAVKVIVGHSRVVPPSALIAYCGYAYTPVAMSGQNGHERGTLFATTIRFDRELVAAAQADADRLGVPFSTYVRDAVRERVAGGRYRGALGQLLARIERMEQDRDRSNA